MFKEPIWVFMFYLLWIGIFLVALTIWLEKHKPRGPR